MSIDYWMYLGPYAKCEVTKKPGTRQEYICSYTCNAMHSYPSRAKFCSACGEKIKEIDVPCEVIATSSNEVLRLVKGDLTFWDMDNGFIVWVPNDGSRDFGHDIDRHGFPLLIPVKDANAIYEEISKFEIAYSKEIDILREQYGGRVKLEWGFVGTAS